MANNNNHTLEQTLFKAADKLRKNINAAEYKSVVLGLIFLKYISDSFEYLHESLIKQEAEGADPEDRDEYKAENVFFVPKEARWSYIQSRAKLPTIGEDLDNAMESIEKENHSLKDILPKVYSRSYLDKQSLGGLIDLISNISLSDESKEHKDLLGRIYEYFLGEFALAEGKKAGQFYTPKSIVQTMVEMIEPYNGRVYDPCCGSGGMFVMSDKFVQEHQGRRNNISIYGQESNQTTWKLCRMNLAVRGIDGTQVLWNTEGSFLNDLHPTLKADYILANPPFNDSDWSGELLKDDARWVHGIPPTGNANYAWMQHMIYHLAPNGSMATVLSNGSLSSNTSNEGEIRKNILKADLIDCILMLPKQLFYNTGIPACVWFISRNKKDGVHRDRSNEVLFIDASDLGFMKDRTHREFTDEDIDRITDTYHEWKKKDGKHEDVKGFCKSATLDDIEKNNFVLTPGRYVGIKEEEDDGIPFEEKMDILVRELKANMEEGKVLDEKVKESLREIGFQVEEN